MKQILPYQSIRLTVTSGCPSWAGNTSLVITSFLWKCLVQTRELLVTFRFLFSKNWYKK